MVTIPLQRIINQIVHEFFARAAHEKSREFEELCSSGGINKGPTYYRNAAIHLQRARLGDKLGRANGELNSPCARYLFLIIVIDAREERSDETLPRE